MNISDVASAGVFAVVVTYVPDRQPLSDLLVALAPQVKNVVIVDNSPASDLSVPLLVGELALPDVEVIRLGNNFGIAKALNMGIARARADGATHVLLSDQDSLPATDMVWQLLEVARQLEAQNERVGCVGAAFCGQSGRMHKFQVPAQGRFFYATCEGDQAVPWVEVISTITSGSLIPIRVFDDVGLMREDYFIDFVDAEWCSRARHEGYKLYGTSLARMEHRVGDSGFRAWYGGWRSFSGYSPDRLYYQYRNGVSMLRSGFVPWGWKLRMGWTWLGNLYAYVLFAPQRIRNLKAILRGIWDGIRGRGGPLARCVP